MLSSKPAIDSKAIDQNKNAQKKTREEVLVISAYLFFTFSMCGVLVFRIAEQYSALSALLS